MNRSHNATPPSEPLETITFARHEAISTDGIDRRNFLRCMAWAGGGLLWTMAGGVPTSRAFAEASNPGAAESQAASEFSFVQISDSHIGFNQEEIRT